MLIPYLVFDVEADWQAKIPTDLTEEQVQTLNEFLHQCGVLGEFEDLLYQEVDPNEEKKE